MVRLNTTPKCLFPLSLASSSPLITHYSLPPLLPSPPLLSFLYPKSISSVKEIRLYLPPGKLKMQADSRQIHLAVKVSMALFNSKVGSEKNSVPRLPCVLRTESPPQIFILMKQPGPHKTTVAVSHSALWQTNKCYGLSSLAQPDTNILYGTSKGSDITTMPLPKSILGFQSTKPLFTKSVELIQALPLLRTPQTCPLCLTPSSACISLPLTVMSTQTKPIAWWL